MASDGLRAERKVDAVNPALTLLAASLAAILGFGSAWQLQAANITKINLEQKDERIAIQRAARQVIERQTAQLATAQSNAAGRAVVIRRDVDGSRAELDGLRQSTEAAMRRASASLDACAVAAATAHQLLNQCGAEYQEMGAKADRHVSDIITLTESWPKN